MALNLTASLSLNSRGFTSGMDNATDSVEDLSRAAGGLPARVRPASQALERLEHDAESTSNAVDRSASTMTAAFSGLAGVLAGLGLGATAIASTKFSDALALVSTLVDETTFNMDQLTASALSAGGEFGAMPVESAKAFYNAISAGADTAEKATDAFNAANKLAIGGNASVEISIDGLTTAMNAYGGKAGTFTDISDAMFVAMKAGKNTISELADAIGNVAPIAAQAGASFDEVLAATASLTKGGVKTSTAMDGIRAVLAATIKPSSEAATLAKTLGLEFNAAALKTKGLAGFLKDLTDKTGGSTEKLAILFGGVEALSPVLSLTGTGAKDFANTLDLMRVKSGATEAAFTKMTDSYGFQGSRIFASVSAQLSSFAVNSSGVLIPALTSLANGVVWFGQKTEQLGDTWSGFVENFKTGGGIFQVLRDVVDGLGAGFDVISTAIAPVIPYISEFAQTFAGVVAGLSGSGLLFAGLAAAIGLVGTAIGGLGALLLANPITATIAAIAASAKLIYDNWDSVGDFFTGLWRDVSSAFSNGLSFATDLLGSSTFGASLLKSVVPYFNQISTKVTDTWRHISAVMSDQGLVQGSVTIFKQIASGAYAAVIGLPEQIRQLWDTITSTVTSDAATSRAGEIWTALVPQLLAAGDDIKNGLLSVWTDINAGLAVAFDDMSEIWNEITQTFNAFMSLFGDDAATGIANIQAAFSTGWNAIKDIFNGVWNAIKGIVGTAWDLVTGIIVVGLKVLRGDWQGAWDGLVEVVQEFWTNIKGIFTGLVEDFGQFGSDIAAGLANGISNAASGAVDAAKGMASSVADGVTDFFGIKSPSRLMMAFGNNIAEGLGIGIDDGAAGAVGATQSMAEKIFGASSGLGDSIKNEVVTGLESMIDTGNDLLDSLIDKFIEAALSADSLGGFMSSLGGSGAGGGASGGGVGGFISSLLGFQHGGSFDVGGSGGTDSQLVAFKASPNERVTIETPGQQQAGQGGQAVSVNTPVYVNIHNAPEGATVEEKQTDQGVFVDVFLADMANDGEMSQSLQGHFQGMSRQGQL